jgi:hypothetical protein
MRSTLCAIAWVVGMIGGLVGFDAVAGEAPTTQGVPLAVLSGPSSKVSEASYRRVTSSDQWKRVWLDHLGLSDDTIYRPAFEVDFQRCMVLAVFRGKMVNVASERVDSVTETERAIVVRIDDTGYQTGGIGSDDHADHVTPYVFVVLPKSGKQIILENNVQPYLGQPPEWKELARIEAVGR